MKKRAVIRLNLEVEFEDNGEDELNDQAFDALKEKYRIESHEIGDGDVTDIEDFE